MDNKKEKIIVGTLLLISVAMFFAFGFFHLTKFETTDEHLWKYGRIKQYWKAIGDKNWEKTYINDKPGVTIALFSGSGLLFESNPEKYEKSGNVEQAEFINLIFRLPILILATLSLFLFFWLGWKAFDSLWTALFSVMFLALNPILIGITQIINPDSYLWFFGGLSVFSYLAFLNKKERKFLILAGIFMGFAMLSKYTALILFLYFLLIILAKMIFQKEKETLLGYKFLFKEILNLVLIFAISLLIFAIFLPAVFVHPNYLVKGVSQFLERGNFALISILGLIILSAILFFRKRIFSASADFLVKNKKIFLISTVCLFLTVSFLMLINVWSGQKLIPFDELRDSAYANEPKKFYFGKEFSHLGFLEKNFKLFMLEAYPFFFSLPPLFFLLILFLLLKSLLGKIKNYSAIILFATVSFSLIYFLITLVIRVVANVRYSITLQFILAPFLAIAVYELLRSLKKEEKKHRILSAVLILLIGFFSLWLSRPFYFSYESPFLSKKFTINSSWGHGFYEAAQYLNDKPDAEKLYTWSNSSTICSFLKGKCTSSKKIDLNVVKPDYFVISKRGTLKEKDKFIFINPDYNGKPAEWYYDNLQNGSEWSIFINERQENFVKIIKFEK